MQGLESALHTLTRARQEAERSYGHLSVELSDLEIARRISHVISAREYRPGDHETDHAAASLCFMLTGSPEMPEEWKPKPLGHDCPQIEMKVNQVAKPAPNPVETVPHVSQEMVDGFERVYHSTKDGSWTLGPLVR